MGVVSASLFVWATLQSIAFLGLWFAPRQPAIHLPEPTADLIFQNVSVWIGWALMGAGTVAAILSVGSVKRSFIKVPSSRHQTKLRVAGIHRWVRHPMYTGLMTVALGYAMTQQSWLKFILLHPIWMLFSARAHFMEAKLKQKFPAYSNYAKQTPRFIPKMSLRPWEDHPKVHVEQPAAEAQSH